MAATLVMMHAIVAAPYNSTFAPYNDTYKPPYCTSRPCYNNTYRCTAWTTLATTVKYCDGPGGKHPSDLNKLLGPKCSVSSGAQRGNGCCWQPLGYDDGPAFGSKCSAVCASQGYMAPRAGLDTAYCRSSDGKPFGNCFCGPPFIPPTRGILLSSKLLCRGRDCNNALQFAPWYNWYNGGSPSHPRPDQWGNVYSRQFVPAIPLVATEVELGSDGFITFPNYDPTNLINGETTVDYMAVTGHPPPSQAGLGYWALMLSQVPVASQKAKGNGPPYGRWLLNGDGTLSPIGTGLSKIPELVLGWGLCSETRWGCETGINQTVLVNASQPDAIKITLCAHSGCRGPWPPA